MDAKLTGRLLPIAAAVLLVAACAQASSVGAGAPGSSAPPSKLTSAAPSLTTPTSAAPSPAVLPSVAATSAAPAPSPSVSPSSTGPGTGGKVSGLVGRWAVHAKGEPATTRLILDGKSGLSVYRHCGTIDGSWRASSGGVLIDSLYGGSEACFASHATDFSSVPWLWKAHGFRTVAGGWLLLDANGLELAKLTPGSKPYVPPTILSSEADPPSLSSTDKATLDRPPAALPTGLIAATTKTAAGTWVPADGTRGYVTLTTGGGWRGSDGCNDTSGSWAVLDGGVILATTGPSTLVGCSGTDVGRKLITASTAGFDGKMLELVGPDGKVTVRLQPGSPPPPAP
jgi:hypothetical protein